MTKAKKILLLITSIILIVSLAAGSMFIYLQYFNTAAAANNNNASKLNEDTSFLTYMDQNNSKNATGNSAAFKKNVVFLDEKQSKDLQAVNSAKFTEDGNLLLTYDSSSDVIRKLNNGSIIYIPKITDGLFAETSIYKIENKKDAGNKVEIELCTPAIDEVFDKLKINVEELLTSEKATAIEALPGVKVSNDAKKYSELKNSVSSAAPAKIENTKASGMALKSKGGPGEEITGVSDDEASSPFLLEIDNIDLVPILTGKSKTSEGDNSLSIMLNGKIGFEKIDFYHEIDYDIMYPYLFKELSFGARGDFLSDVKVDFNMVDLNIHDIIKEASRNKNDQDDKIDWDVVVIEGLKDNTIPIACIYFSLTNGIVTTNTNVSKTMPLYAQVVVSMDLEGNVTLKATAGIKATQRVDFAKVSIISQNKIADTKGTAPAPEKEDPYKLNVDFNLGLEASADIDFQVLNFNVGVGIFNLNVARFTATAFGISINGDVKAQVDKNGFSGNLNGYCDLYTRGKIKANLSVKVKLFLQQKSAEDGITKYSDQENGGFGFDLDFSYTIWDHKFCTSGALPTLYDPKTMVYNQITAYDSDYIYYKDINGYLVKCPRNNPEDKKIIMPSDFFLIVGIDSSFIYVLKDVNSDGSLSICRIAKKGYGYRVIQEHAGRCVYQDSRYIYYVPDDKNNKVCRLDKKSLNSGDFTTVDADSSGFFSDGWKIQLMLDRSDAEFLLIMTERSFFSADTKYYAVNKQSGAATPINRDYPNFIKQQFKNYNIAVNYTSSDYLRYGVAEEVYWESKDGSINKKIEGMSGWNPLEDGILTQVNNEDPATRDEKPFVISLCAAQTGEIRSLWPTASNQAFFTFMQYNNKYYFIDQTQTDYILYSSGSLSSAPEKKLSIPTSEFNLSLQNCAATLIDGVMFFYSIDGTKSRLLYIDKNTIREA